MLHLDNYYGGMPCKAPETKPIITFSDMRVGLKAKAVKNCGIKASKGEIVTVTKTDGDKIYFKSRTGEQNISPIEFFLYFTHPDG